MGDRCPALVPDGASRVLARSTTLYSLLWVRCPRELPKPGADDPNGYREGACYMGRFGWQVSLHKNPKFKVKEAQIINGLFFADRKQRTGASSD